MRPPSAWAAIVATLCTVLVVVRMWGGGMTYFDLFWLGACVLSFGTLALFFLRDLRYRGWVKCPKCLDKVPESFTEPVLPPVADSVLGSDPYTGHRLCKCCLGKARVKPMLGESPGDFEARNQKAWIEYHDTQRQILREMRAMVLQQGQKKEGES